MAYLYTKQQIIVGARSVVIGPRLDVWGREITANKWQWPGRQGLHLL